MKPETSRVSVREKLVLLALLVPLVLLVAATVGPQSPIYRLLLQSDADGGGNSFTNLKNLKVTNIAFIEVIAGSATQQFASSIAGQTPWLTNIDGAGFSASNINNLSPTNVHVRGILDLHGVIETNVTIIYGPSNTTMSIGAGSVNSQSNSAAGLNIFGGFANATGSIGGPVLVSGGPGTVGTNARGGLINLKGGDGGYNGDGGAATLQAGNAGAPNGNGGTTIVRGGAAFFSGTPGNLLLRGGMSDGHAQGWVFVGHNDGFGNVTTNAFIGVNYVSNRMILHDTNNNAAVVLDNAIMMMSNRWAAIGIRTNNTGTNALVVRGGADIDFLFLNGIPLVPNSGTNNVVQSFYSYGTYNVPTSAGFIFWNFFFSIANNIRVKFTTPIGSGTSGVQFTVPVNGWVSTDPNTTETHELYILGGGTNMPITFGEAGAQNWIWIGDNGTQYAPTNLAVDQLYVIRVRHRGGNTNILATWLTTTNANADY